MYQMHWSWSSSIKKTMNHIEFTQNDKQSILCIMSDTKIAMKFENLPNEILFDCFEYFHKLDLLYSFGRLNHRFDQLFQTLPWRLNFENIKRETYDEVCQDMLVNPDVQQRIFSLRLSNRDTPGIINDFFSKFSLDQFSQLRSLTLFDLQNNNIESLKQILPKLSQITTLQLFDAEIHVSKLQSSIPISNLRTLSLKSNLSFVQNPISIKNLTLSNMSLNEICRLFVYTPLLQYLKVSYIRDKLLRAEYHQSPRPGHLRQLILADFRPMFDDLTHFLQDMSNLRSLTIDSSSDRRMVDASRWEELITFSLPLLQTFQFHLRMYDSLDRSTGLQIFERFQTDFWLEKHHWHSQCSVEKRSIMIYTIPYLADWRQISLRSRRFCNPLIENSQAFKDVNTLIVSYSEVLDHENYYFPNIKSLVITDVFQIVNGEEGQEFITALNSLINLSNLKHLEIPLDCQTKRPSVLFRILQLAPQLSSLHTKGCFFELSVIPPEFYQCLNDRIRKLDLDEYCSRQCHQPLTINSLYKIVPNLQQLTVTINNIDDLFFVFDHFSKLSNFKVYINSNEYPQHLQEFKRKASEQKTLFDETVGMFRNKILIDLSVWIQKNKLLLSKSLPIHSDKQTILCILSKTQSVMKLENLPNEILISCFEYFHALDLFFSFDQLNHRLNQLIRTLPLHLNFQGSQKDAYDGFCQYMVIHSDAQQRVYSLRLSNENTPGQINDFLSKFSLDQFSRLCLLTFFDLNDNNISALKEILPKLSQITALHLVESQFSDYELEPLIPIDHLQKLSITSGLSFLQRTISIKILTLRHSSLSDLCRLFQYTPLLEYFKVFSIRKELFQCEYDQSPRLVHLKHLNLGRFNSTFDDLTRFLKNLSNLRRLTINSASDRRMIDASRWEELITSFLSHLKDFRFKFELKTCQQTETLLQIFEQFQTDFWLKQHHWHTECSCRNYSSVIYTIPYKIEFSSLSLNSRRFSNPLFDDSQTFKDLHKLDIVWNDLLEHGNYYFPNVISLRITDSLPITNENDERHMIESLNSLVIFSNLKHLEIPLDCQSERPTLLIRLFELAPQLSSLCTKRCFFELSAANPESSRYFKDKIRKLYLKEYCSHSHHQSCQMNLMYQSVPNLQQLRMAMTNIVDLFFLFKHFTKLTSFTIHFTMTSYPAELQVFKKEASEHNAIVDEAIKTIGSSQLLITIGVWIISMNNPSNSSLLFLSG